MEKKNQKLQASEAVMTRNKSIFFIWNGDSLKELGKLIYLLWKRENGMEEEQECLIHKFFPYKEAMSG